MRALRSPVLSVVLVVGCHAEDEIEDPQGCVECGECEEMACAPGEWLRDGSCVPAGIPIDACGVGFEHDGDGGCVAVLPDAPCPPGSMAIVGETRCRAVATCGAGTWGDIPVEASNQHVDASYAGLDSDGTMAKPWTSVQAAVDAAAPGAIVAVAEGSYVEKVDIGDKSVRLWGVCPERVELGTVQLLAGADGTEVHAVAIRGIAHGIAVFGAVDVVLDRLWVHDNPGPGVAAQDTFAPTSVVVTASLVEKNHGTGVFVGSSELALEDSVVRTTLRDAQAFLGRGLNARAHPRTGVRSTVSVVRSLIEQNFDLGMLVEASDLTMESSVVRHNQPDPQNEAGVGVSIESDPATTAPATAVLRTSLVEENRGFGVFVQGSDATLEAIVVRGTVPDAKGLVGRGVAAQSDPLSGAPSNLVVRSSLVDHNSEVGVFITDSHATIEASVVRATVPNALGMAGRGVNVRTSAGVSPSTLLLQSSIVEESTEAGVVIASSNGTVDSCLIRDTHPNTSGLYGEGVVVAYEQGAASGTITATRVERSARAALSAFGAHAATGCSLFSCQALDFSVGTYHNVDANLEDLGGNRCGCPEPDGGCRATGANLEPPEPLPPKP